MTIRRDVWHYYRRARQHQLATYGNSGLHIAGVDQRQFTGGSAAYGYHAAAAHQSARRAIHFRQTLAADLKAHSRRSRAARQGWKTRRAQRP